MEELADDQEHGAPRPSGPWEQMLLTTHRPSENCAGADHIPWNAPFPHLTFRNALLKPSGSSEFWEGWHKPLLLLASPCNKPFSAPDSNISVSWALLCVGTGMCVRVTEAHVTNFRSPCNQTFLNQKVECLCCTEKENPFMWPFFCLSTFNHVLWDLISFDLPNPV